MGDTRPARPGGPRGRLPSDIADLWRKTVWPEIQHPWRACPREDARRPSIRGHFRSWQNRIISRLMAEIAPTRRQQKRPAREASTRMRSAEVRSEKLKNSGCSRLNIRRLHPPMSGGVAGGHARRGRSYAARRASSRRYRKPASKPEACSIIWASRMVPREMMPRSIILRQ